MYQVHIRFIYTLQFLPVFIDDVSWTLLFFPGLYRISICVRQTATNEVSAVTYLPSVSQEAYRLKRLIFAQLEELCEENIKI